MTVPIIPAETPAAVSRTRCGRGRLVMLVTAGLIVTSGLYWREQRATTEAKEAGKQALDARLLAERKSEEAQAAEQKADARSRQLRSAMYVAQIGLAQNVYDTGQLQRISEFLYTRPADRRNWEWYRLVYSTDRSLMSLSGHESWVNCLAWNPSGKKLVAGYADGRAGLWDVVTGQMSRTLNRAVGTTTAWPSTEGI